VSDRLVVTAVAKNVGRNARRVFGRLAGLAGAFEDLAFVVYENNSTDSTKSELERLAREVPNFRLISEDLSRAEIESFARARHMDGSPCRIELIARGRNIARQALLSDFGDYDQVLVIDPDALWFSRRDILRNAGRISRDEADAICANGLTKWLYYRDAFAFRSRAHPWGPEYLGEGWWRETKPKIQGRYRGTTLVPVNSAFGGAALYSMAAYRQGRYLAMADERYIEQQAGYDTSGAPSKERSAAAAKPMANSDYSGPIVCEHVPFCYSMREAGFGRIFIDPAWRLLFRD